MIKIILSILIFFYANIIYAEEKNTRENYIQKYKQIAMDNMVKYKIPASIILAQGCLESGNGNSTLANKSNNHFGIKCHKSWKGKKVYHDDDKKNECFRVYKKVEDSYADHANFLKKPRYAKCFKLNILNYKGWAKELKKAGYATNPKYPQLLIKIIEDNELYNYDKQILNKKKKKRKKKKDNDDLNNSTIGINNRLDIKISKNNIKYTEAEKGQTAKQLADMFELGIWQIYNYNDVDKHKIFSKGERVYLQPKRRKANIDFYTVENDWETLRYVSQKYGIKMGALRRKNRFKKNQKLKIGMKLHLKKKKPKGELYY